MKAVWLNMTVCTAFAAASVLCTAESNDLSSAEWGDVSTVEVKGIRLGMTRAEVGKLLGEVQVPAFASGVPSVYKVYNTVSNVNNKLTVYFGSSSVCSNRVVGIESTFYGASMLDRNTIVDALQEKYGFEDDYLEHRPKGSIEQLKNDFVHLPQYEQKLNDFVSVLLRLEWDNKKQRTHLITVFYKHLYYDVTADSVRSAKPSTEEQERKEQIREFL